MIRLGPWLALMLICSAAPWLSAQDIGADWPPRSAIPHAPCALSPQAQRLAEAYAQYAAGMLALHEENRFSRRAEAHFLAALASDPGSREPLEALLSGWTREGEPPKTDFRRVVRKLLPLARANPQAWRLVGATADALLRLDRGEEALPLLEAAMDTLVESPAAAVTGDNDGLELIAITAAAYGMLERFTEGERLFRRLSRLPPLAENFLFQRTAIEFFALQADQGEDDGWWLFPSRRRRFATALDEHLAAADAAWRRQALAAAEHQRPLPVMDLAGVLRVCKRYQRFALGESLIGEALLSDPHDLRATLFLAAFLADADRHADAARLWRRIVAAKPDEADFHLELGRMTLLAGWPDEAVREFDAYLLLKPGDPDATYQAAFAYHELGKDDKVLFLLEQLPELPEAQYLAAMTLRRLDRHAEAAAAMVKAESLFSAKAAAGEGDPPSLEFLMNFAYFCDRAKDYDRTLTILERLRREHPDSPEVANYFGYFLAERNLRLDEAETFIRQALHAEPDNPAYLDSLAWVLYRQGRHAEAARQIELAIARQQQDDEPIDAVIADHAGDIYLALGDLKRARDFWQQAALYHHEELDPATVLAKLARHEQ